MPLTHIGQLKPTMQQQIALQKALLALQREEEKPIEEPALSRRLVTEGPKPYAGPVSGLAPREAFRGGMEYATPTRAPLERALAPSEPAPDWQAEARTRREEIVEERKAKAKGLYDRLLPLNEEGRQIVLKAAPRELVRAMEQEGYISPEGALAEPEKEKKVINVSQWTDESGWLQQTTVYEDGTSKTEILGRAAKEEAKGLTPSEQLGWARLEFDISKEEEPYYAQAMENLGKLPSVGEVLADGTKITDKNVEQVQKNYWMDVGSIANRLRMDTEGIKNMDDVKTKYQYDTEAIKNFQRNFGLTVDGVWSDMLGQVIYEAVFKEE